MIETLLGLSLLIAPLNPLYDSKPPEPKVLSAFDIAEQEFTKTDMVSTTTAKQAILEVFGTTTGAIMVNVAKCESGLLQYDKPNRPHKNKTSSATGLFQVMKSIHNETALEKDMNIYTLEGNILFARELYEESGLKPWASSKPCWSKLSLNT